MFMCDARAELANTLPSETVYMFMYDARAELENTCHRKQYICSCVPLKQPATSGIPYFL